MSKKNRLGAFLIILFLFFLPGCEPEVQSPARAGIGISSAADIRLWGERLGAEWYLDWSVSTDRNSGLERWQMVRVSPEGFRPGVKELTRLVKKNRGQVWVIGNEPDNAAQDAVEAVRYAEIFHEVYGLIKEADPTALVAVGGVTQPSPSRMAYLDVVLDAYQEFYGERLPADWWTVHAYVLNESEGAWGAGLPVGMDSKPGLTRELADHGSLDLFGAQIENFRQWMMANGYQNTPLAVTEFGILLSDQEGYSQEFIAQYLLQACAWLDEANDPISGYPDDEYRLVQRWAWFSLSDPLYPASDLADLELNRLTPVGEAYRAYMVPRQSE